MAEPFFPAGVIPGAGIIPGGIIGPARAAGAPGIICAPAGIIGAAAGAGPTSRDALRPSPRLCVPATTRYTVPAALAAPSAACYGDRQVVLTGFRGVLSRAACLLRRFLLFCFFFVFSLSTARSSEGRSSFGVRGWIFFIFVSTVIRYYVVWKMLRLQEDPHLLITIAVFYGEFSMLHV